MDAIDFLLEKHSLRKPSHAFGSELVKMSDIEKACCCVTAFNQSINQGIQCPGGQLGPNRQEVQFSEFIQTRFVSYMQSIP